MKGNEHLTVRQQFYVRMADKILKNSDAAYLFMGVVCDTVSLAELPTIEAVFVSKVQQKQPSKN